MGKIFSENQYGQSKIEHICKILILYLKYSIIFYLIYCKKSPINYQKMLISKSSKSD